MSKLHTERCETCNADAPRISQEAAETLLLELDSWELFNLHSTPQLMKVYVFGNFMEALVFTNKVGALAEFEHHHPAILLEWGRVTVRWWTHKIKGLHRNDFIMAAKTDLLSAMKVSV